MMLFRAVARCPLYTPTDVIKLQGRSLDVGVFEQIKVAMRADDLFDRKAPAIAVRALDDVGYVSTSGSSPLREGRKL
jgi:hypothetical protein